MKETYRERSDWVFPTHLGEARLRTDRIFANDVTFPWEYNPHNVRPWIIFGEYGAIGLVWAEHESDALDEAADSEILDGYLVSEEDYNEMGEAEREELALLGNADEPFDLSYVNLSVVDPKSFSKELVALFAAAREAGYTTLDR